jgi:phosphonate transport system substrate-binding protein
MSRNRLTLLLIGTLALLLALAACSPEATEVVVTRVVTEIQEQEIEVPVEVTRIVEQIQTRVVTEEVIVEEEMAPLGSEERPIKVLFVPSTEVDFIITGGELMADALKEATGLSFDVSVPTSYGATVEEMCASPDDTIAFLAPQAYVLANDACGVTVGAAPVRFGLPWYAAQIVVSADSPAESIEDLDGLTWGIPDFGSTSGYLFPTAMFQAAGVETGEVVETGGHPNAMLAVYNGEVDFATAYYSPPLLPYFERQWTYGIDDPEIWREAGESPVRTEEGRTFVAGGPDEGGYRLLDARAAVSDTAPDIYDKTRVLTLTDQIPNDTISFGPAFPLNTANQIISVLEEWVSEDNEACMQSICNEEFYGWTEVTAVSDSFYDPVRFLMETLGVSAEDVLGG